MRMVDIIERKRNGAELTKEELHTFIEGYTKGEIPDYQASAFLMATYFNGMTAKEQATFALEMLHSGDEVDLSLIPGIKVDKHSTGGVGDKTSIPLAPDDRCVRYSDPDDLGSWSGTYWRNIR